MQDQGYWISACGQVTKNYVQHIRNLLGVYQPNVEIKLVGATSIWEVSETRLARKNMHVPGTSEVSQSVERKGLAIVIHRTVVTDDKLVPYLTMSGIRLKGCAPVPRRTTKAWTFTIPSEMVTRLLAKAKKGKLAERGYRIGLEAARLLAVSSTVPLTYETWLEFVKAYWPAKAKAQPCRKLFKAIQIRLGLVRSGTVAGLRAYRILGARQEPIWMPKPVRVRLGLVVQCSTRCSHAKFERTQAERAAAKSNANEWAKLCQQLKKELAKADPSSRAINYLETLASAHEATFWDNMASQVYR
jgi:hypothetical protein